MGNCGKESTFENFRYDANSLLENIEQYKPQRELYNIIYSTIHGTFKENENGYAITLSEILSTKIWSLACDWESLITRKMTPKQIVTGLTVHRLTGNKEVVSSLHKLNHCISYNDVRKYNNEWTKNNGTPTPKTLHMGISTHARIDNNDGNQETATGKGTSHDTNMTIFQPLIRSSLLSLCMLISL